MLISNQVMKLLLVLLSFVVASQTISYPELVNEEWKLFKVQYERRYSSPTEEQRRLETYLKNRKMIAEHNKRYAEGEFSYKLEMNQFGDMSHHEFVTLMGLFNRTDNLSGREGVSASGPRNVQAPKEIDWRQKGAVTPVKNQGGCGSCWCFSSTGAIESHRFLKTGRLVPLSVQNLIDCSKAYGTQGCRGGWMDDAFRYVQANGGIDTEESYPYEGKESYCRYNAKYSGGTIKGFVDIEVGNEVQLQNAVGNVGPVAVVFDASLASLQFYSTGIYYETSCRNNNPVHAVLVIGYGSECGSDYWLVKNSWAATWGDGGYFKIARNRNNHCGIASWASYPIV
ncbi:cathepsin L1 isoform X1 [Anabrus simplex]|uniref:cathepsin L1 isoform X1 n=1 Tax=Anabrus simplex TaxID=316456 RepID=UPI0035A32A2F